MFASASTLIGVELSINLIWFICLVDSGRTGYVINKEHIQKYRQKYGQSYPDFLMKYDKPYYKSKSIIGILYRNALLYKKGNIDELNNAFAQMGIDDNRLNISTTRPLSSLVRKLLILLRFIWF